MSLFGWLSLLSISCTLAYGNGSIFFSLINIWCKNYLPLWPSSSISDMLNRYSMSLGSNSCGTQFSCFWFFNILLVHPDFDNNLQEVVMPLSSSNFFGWFCHSLSSVSNSPRHSIKAMKDKPCYESHVFKLFTQIEKVTK